MGSFEQARRVPTGDSKASRDSCCRRHSGNISKPTPGLLLIAGLTIRLPECAKDYAETVREFSRLSSFKSLYSGPRFLSLGDFLWRPYEHRATTTRYRPTTAAHQFEPFPFLMVLNWQEGPEKRIQQLSTVDQLQTVDKSTANLVVLKGYPTAEWLNALGAKFRIDPDFYQRHLCFWSESGNNTSRRNMAPRLPSVQAETIGLRIPTIGKLTGRKQPTHRDAVLENLEHIRRQTSQRMTAYISQLSTLESPDMDVAYSIVREFVMLDANHFAIEQIISISIVANRNGGWTSKSWRNIYVFKKKLIWVQAQYGRMSVAVLMRVWTGPGDRKCPNWTTQKSYSSPFPSSNPGSLLNAEGAAGTIVHRMLNTKAHRYSSKNMTSTSIARKLLLIRCTP